MAALLLEPTAEENSANLGVGVGIQRQPPIGTEFGEGDAAKQKSVKRSAFSLNQSEAFSE